jgi:hypothetical protein
MIPVAVIALAAVVVILGVIEARRRRAGSERLNAAEEGHGLSDSAAAAMEDVAGPLFGVNAHPTSPEALRRRIP